MRPRDPRHKYIALSTRKQLPNTGAERTIYYLIHGADTFNKDLPLKTWDPAQVYDPVALYCWEIYNNLNLKNIFEAFLFSTVDDNQVHESLGVDLDEIGFYREIFFDATVFKNDLERISWIQTIPEDSPHKELYRIAFNQGFAALRWHYCRDKGSVTPDEAEQIVLTDSLMQYLSHRGKPLTNKVAKEARNLSRIIIDTVRTMRSKNMSNEMPVTSEALRFRFEQIRTQRTITDLKNDGIEVMN